MFGYTYGLSIPTINFKQCKYESGRRKINYNIFADQQSLYKEGGSENNKNKT